MNSINRQPKQIRRKDQYSTFDKTSQTFIDKLRCYQQFSDVSKIKQKQQQIKRNAQRIKQKLSYEIKSPRNIISQSLGKTIKGNKLSNNYPNTKQQLKLTTPSIIITNNNPTHQNNKQTSFSLINTKFTSQQRYFQQQIQKVVNQLSIIDTRYSSHKDQHQQTSRLNFLQLDNFQKYLMTCQKQYQKEYNLVVDKTKEQVSLLIEQKVMNVRNKHKLHLQSSFKTLKLVDQQQELLKQGMINQSQLCQSQWCIELDKINQHILQLNNLITEVRLQETDRFTDLQWKVKEVQFSCEDSVDQERKNRLSQQHKIYAVIEQLIQKVAMPL